MNILSRIFQTPKNLTRAVDLEIASQQATLRQNVQIVQSGARVVETMSGAMRVMMELERGKNTQ